MNAVKAIVLIVLTVVYLYEMILNLVRMRSADNPVPENVSDVYDKNTYLLYKISPEISQIMRLGIQ